MSEDHLGKVLSLCAPLRFIKLRNEVIITVARIFEEALSNDNKLPFTSIFDASYKLYTKYCSRQGGAKSVLFPLDTLYISAILNQAVMRDTLSWNSGQTPSRSNYIPNSIIPEEYAELAKLLHHQFTPQEISLALSLMRDRLGFTFVQEEGRMIVHSPDSNISASRKRMSESDFSYYQSSTCYTIMIWLSMHDRMLYDHPHENEQGGSSARRAPRRRRPEPTKEDSPKPEPVKDVEEAK
jgi:hypothetical protein